MKLKLKYLNLLMFPVLGIVAFSPASASGQSLSADQRQRVSDLVNSQVEATLKTEEGIRKQADVLEQIMKFNLEVLNKRLRGAGLRESSMQQYMCADSFASYPYNVVIKVSPECKRMPSYIRKAFSNLSLTTEERDEQSRLHLASDGAVEQTKHWLDKRKELADSVLEGGSYRPVPGPALRQLYEILFAKVDSNKYKVDFDKMEFVPKARNEYLERPFDLFWKALGDYIHRRADAEKHSK